MQLPGARKSYGVGPLITSARNVSCDGPRLRSVSGRGGDVVPTTCASKTKGAGANSSAALPACASTPRP